MDRMLVIAFDGEATAAEAIRLLAALDDEQAVTIYAAACVTKDAAGAVTVRDAAVCVPHDAILAVATRRLAALIRRAATFSGLAVADLARIGVEADFVEEARRRLSPGAAALVAEIEEAGVLPVDGRMEHLGGRVMRQARAPVADALNYCQLAVREEDLADLEAEYARANGAARARLQGPLGEAQARRDAARSLAQSGIDIRRREAEAKIRLLLRQAAKADDGRKTTIKRQIGAIRAEYVLQAATLRAAWQLETEALSI